TLSNLLLDRPMHVWKRGSHATQDILQTAQARSLARQGNLLHHIIPKELTGGINLILIEDQIHEASNNNTVVVHNMVMWSPNETQEHGELGSRRVDGKPER